ncbi:hypothetical protein [Ideonella sp. BN130291]|uniref:hypothetical protein n=1 Tax=Ideonella sp. BN130291 TaxID=3112940 RepID=UPI002E255439|nr:hypothetical protein [Ideonella sp. BN130291]
MNTWHTTFGIALGLVTAVASAADPNHGKAAVRCEDAVSDTIVQTRGKQAQDVQFIGTKRAITSDGDDIGVKGEGRYRRAAATVPFTYSCAFNVKTGGTSGVVFKEAADTGSGDTKAAWQPDLTNVSPQACETAVAALLKDQHPRVSGIAFRADTRQLQPAPNARIGLEGQGSLQRAPGMNANAFKYRCEFDARSGKVLAAKASD